MRTYAISKLKSQSCILIFFKITFVPKFKDCFCHLQARNHLAINNFIVFYSNVKAFEIWCYRIMLKISVQNAHEVLRSFLLNRFFFFVKISLLIWSRSIRLDIFSCTWTHEGKNPSWLCLYHPLCRCGALLHWLLSQGMSSCEWSIWGITRPPFP